MLPSIPVETAALPLFGPPPVLVVVPEVPPPVAAVGGGFGVAATDPAAHETPESADAICSCVITPTHPEPGWLDGRQ